ncbi:hypothetical protein [Streptomyces sp. NPDC048411]|uniref:hypothetical protein n=1 Tax=Streptomyces sp. NPDC048411 TaxID=3157206 RepID=UPI0034558591
MAVPGGVGDAVEVNGRSSDRSWTEARLVTRGVSLTYRSAEQPNTGWATAPSGIPQ